MSNLWWLFKTLGEFSSKCVIDFSREGSKNWIFLIHAENLTGNTLITHLFLYPSLKDV